MHPEKLGFPLTTEQVELYDLAASYASDRLAPGAAERDRIGRFPVEIIGECAEMGWMAIKVPEALGGPGADNVSFALMMAALARVDVSVAVSISAANLVSCVIAEHGTDDQKERWLRPICSGAKGVTSFCLSEPGAGSDAAALTTEVRDGRLHGSKMWITSGEHAGVYLVFAKEAGGISAYLLPKGAPGLTIGREEDKMGQRASGTVALHLDGVPAREADRIGPPGRGYRLALSALGAGRVGIAGVCLGLGEAAFALGRAYAHERRAFGKRLCDFQNTQFVLADARLELDAAWLLTLRAGRLLDIGEDAKAATSMAKLHASEVCGRVCDAMLQIHGGYGYSREYEIERLYRDARVTRIYEGTSEVQRLVIARQLLEPSSEA